MEFLHWEFSFFFFHIATNIYCYLDKIKKYWLKCVLTIQSNNFFFFFFFFFFILPWYVVLFIFFHLKIFYCYSITVVCLFSPSLHSTPAEPPSLPHLQPPPWFCPCVLYSSSYNPLFPLSPPHSTLAVVRLFLTSMSLVIFCLLFSSIDYVPVKGEITWCLSLTIWLISLSIMLSSSIHAVAKGISSFFLSAA